MAIAGVTFAVGNALRRRSLATPYTSRIFGSAGTPVYGPVTYASLIRHDVRAGSCSVREILEAGDPLEDGLVNSLLLYGHYAIPTAGSGSFTIGTEYLSECVAAQGTSSIGPGLVSDAFREAFRRRGHLLSNRLAIVDRTSADAGYLLVDAGRRAMFRLVSEAGQVTVTPLAPYPAVLKLEQFLAQLGWELVWERNGQRRFERNQAPIPLAVPWTRLTLDLEAPVFLPHYQDRNTDLENDPNLAPEERVDQVYGMGDCYLEPDERSHVLFDMPAGTVLSSFPRGEALPAPEATRMRWRVPIGAAGMALAGRTGEAGMVRLKLLNARLARFGLGSLAARRPVALAGAALGAVAGSFGTKILDSVIGPAATGALAWLRRLLNLS